MVDNSFLQGAGGPGPLSGPNGVRPGASKTTDGASGPAFKALLDKLEFQARELAQASASVDGPADLAGAVDSAKESLADALSLSDRLLEAYRAAQQEGGPQGSGSGEG